jgi:hypothetical protein
MNAEGKPNMTRLEKLQEKVAGRFEIIEEVAFDHEKGHQYHVLNLETWEEEIRCTGELTGTKDTSFNNYEPGRRYSVSTHGMSDTPFYHQWKQMKSRCNNSTQPYHGTYSLLGYCEEWENFDNFKRDMYASYKPGLTIDRIDNTKGYSKDNCRWATLKQQQRNKINNTKMLLFDEIPLTVNVIDMADAFGLNAMTLRYRLEINQSPMQALTKQTNKQKERMQAMTPEEQYQFICESNAILEPILEEALEQYINWYDTQLHASEMK